MSITAPTEVEIRDTFLAELDRLAETRTEDRHPAPEFWQWLTRQAGYTIVGMDDVAFADEVFDLWERANATEATIHRWAPDQSLVPSRIHDRIAQVVEDALADLDFMVRRYVIQPPAHLAAPVAVAVGF